MKNPVIELPEGRFLRIPVKTHILTSGEDMAQIIQKYALPQAQEGDVVVLSESPLAITQGRAIPIANMKIGLLARLLWRFVAKVPYGIGLRSPYSMQCAIDEVGGARIIFAAFFGLLGKIVGKKGWFYHVAGRGAATIDAAHTSPVAPYYDTVIMGPYRPEQAAQKLAKACGHEVAVMDINDIGGCQVLGASSGLDVSFMEKVMKDNPQGQGLELTPLCLVRRVEE